MQAELHTLSELKEMHDKLVIPALVSKVEEATDKNGVPFFRIYFSDCSKPYMITVSSKYQRVAFDYFQSCSNETNFLVRLQCERLRPKGERYDIVIDSVYDMPFDSEEQKQEFLSNFQRTAPIERSKLIEDLDNVFKSCGTPFAENIIKEYWDDFIYWAAAETHHHNYTSGLLMHTTFMSSCALFLCDFKANSSKTTYVGRHKELIDFYIRKLAEAPDSQQLSKKMNFAVEITDKFCELYGFDLSPEELEHSRSIASNAIAAIVCYSSKLDETTASGLTKRELYGITAYSGLGLYTKAPLFEDDLTAIEYSIKFAFLPDEEVGRKPYMKEAYIVRAVSHLLDLGVWKDEVSIDTDVLLNGVCLHDIGKLKEFETDTVGNATYTKKGSLLGHLHIGTLMVMRYIGKAKKNGTNYDVNFTQNVLHIIASHHGHLAWDALVEPITLEAKIVFELDMLDSHVEQTRAKSDEMEHGELSKQDNSRYYKL